LAEGLRFNLEAEGYDVQVAETGEAALELLGPGNRFDLMVLDVMLPGKNGFEVIAELRKSGQFIPTLMLTARDVLKTCCSVSKPARTITFPSPLNWRF